MRQKRMMTLPLTVGRHTVVATQGRGPQKRSVRNGDSS